MNDNIHIEQDLMMWKVKPLSQEYQTLGSEIRGVIEKYSSEIPVKLGAMANSFGIDVLLSTFPLGISGQIGEEDENFVIRINRHEVRHRQRFTLAHEISHFLLHKDLIRSTESNYWSENVLLRSGQPLRVEYQANRLASDLVIPPNLLVEETKNIDNPMTTDELQYLAEKFQVSAAAMKFKLQIG